MGKKTKSVTEAAPQLMTDAVRELVAIGAAIAGNCEMCFKFHFDKARKLGVSNDDMLKAVGVGIMVKNANAQSVHELAGRYLKTDGACNCAHKGTEGACCSGSSCS